MMQFYVMARTYNVYGGHPTLSLVPEFLLEDANDFGDALSELTVTFHFPTSSPPRRTLEATYASFHAHRLSLPKTVFRRTKRQATIDIASELIDGEQWKNTRGLLLPLFGTAICETIVALSLLRKRLTPKDDFALEEFLAHCNQSQKSLPATEQDLQAYAEKCQKRRMERLAAMSPWEKLGVDWSEFHANARQILDDPFYWEMSNDFAPHGNDTGADLLADYRKWLRKNPSGEPLLFYKRLLQKWEFREDSAISIEQSAMDEAAVALAFAELKLRGACTPAAVGLARLAIARQRQQALESTGWQHKAARLQSLEMLEAKLSLVR